MFLKVQESYIIIQFPAEYIFLTEHLKSLFLTIFKSIIGPSLNIKLYRNMQKHQTWHKDTI